MGYVIVGVITRVIAGLTRNLNQAGVRTRLRVKPAMTVDGVSL